jgi:hypothetical protein
MLSQWEVEAGSALPNSKSNMDTLNRYIHENNARLVMQSVIIKHNCLLPRYQIWVLYMKLANVTYGLLWISIMYKYTGEYQSSGVLSSGI